MVCPKGGRHESSIRVQRDEMWWEGIGLKEVACWAACTNCVFLCTHTYITGNI